MSATLSETQWMVQSAASQRDDHCAMLPPRLGGARSAPAKFVAGSSGDASMTFLV